MKPLNCKENNYVYVIVDQYNRIIKPQTTGTYIFMNENARNKQLVSKNFIEYCKKNNIIAKGVKMLLTEAFD